jgi:hypothetical protein
VNKLTRLASLAACIALFLVGATLLPSNRGLSILLPVGLLLASLALFVAVLVSSQSNDGALLSRMRPRLPTLLRLSGLFGVGVGLLAAGLAMTAAWDHNPQDVYHSALGINWIPWLAVGVSALASAVFVAFVVAFSLGFVLLAILGSFR